MFRFKHKELAFCSLSLVAVLNHPVAGELMDINNNDNLVTENQQLSNKFKMASYILSMSRLRERIKAANNQFAMVILKHAESDYKVAKQRITEENWLEANAIIDSVIRNLTKVSRLVNEPKFFVKQYQEALKQVESFILPNSENPSEEDLAFITMNQFKINKLVESASAHSKHGDFRKSISDLNKAYALKVLLLDKIKHEKTISYTEDFKTYKAEYIYLLKRGEHYLGLVNMVKHKKNLNKQTIKLVDDYVNQSKSGMDLAKRLAENSSYDQAINILNNAINDLLSALKVMGISV